MSSITITRLELHNAVKSLALASNNMASQLVSVQEASTAMGDANTANIEEYYRKRISGTTDAQVKLQRLLDAMGAKQYMVVDLDSGTIFPDG